MKIELYLFVSFPCRYYIFILLWLFSFCLDFFFLYVKCFELDIEQSVSYQRNWKLKCSFMLRLSWISVLFISVLENSAFSSHIPFCKVELTNNNSVCLREYVVSCHHINKFTVWLLILIGSQFCSIREQMFLE